MIIENMSKKLLYHIKQANKNDKSLSFLITIPNWNDSKEYGKYKGKDILFKSKFLTFKYSVSKENTKFYDYYNNREITPSDMLYIIIQSNKAKLSNNLVNVIKKYFNIF